MREETRARIMDHALRLFARRGYDGTAVRAIADGAGVSPGLLYAYFDDKEALLLALLEEEMDEVRASFAEAEAEGPPEARVERLVRAALAGVRRRPDFWRLSYGLRMQGAVLDGMGERMRVWSESIRGTLEGYLREAGYPEPEAEARVLFGLIDGVAQHATLEGDGYPLEQVVERIVARYRGPAPGS